MRWNPMNAGFQTWTQEPSIIELVGVPEAHGALRYLIHERDKSPPRRRRSDLGIVRSWIITTCYWSVAPTRCHPAQPSHLRTLGAVTPFRVLMVDIPHIPFYFGLQIRNWRPLSHRQGNCIPYAAIRWHDFGNRPALGRPLGHFSRHPDTPLLSLSPRRRFPRPTPERVFVADHQSSSGFSGTGPSAPPPQPIGT